MHEYLFNRLSKQTKRSRFFSKNRTFLDYVWQPSKQFHANTPTLVYFLGYGETISDAANQHSTWNVLGISDSNGPEGKGVWYYGTNGEDYILQSIKQFLTEMILCGLINKHELFFSGEGMGGHAAIHVALELDAKGCLVHNPTTNLYDSEYARGKHKSLFEQIFLGKIANDYSNLQSRFSEIDTNISITHNLEPDQTFFIEQIAPIESHVKDIRFQSKYDFDEIFTYFSGRLSKKQPFIVEQYHTHQSLVAIQVADISLKLNSRKEVIVQTDFSFALDPFSDRSWRFWFQNLSWLFSYLDTLQEDIVQKQADYVISKWITFMEDQQTDSEFFYHDHSLAIRAISLIECMDFFSDEMRKTIIHHLKEIGTLLVSPLEDNALSNHAFDQAIALFLISDFLTTNPSSKAWQEISLTRLERELNYSFTNDGVHVEGSPSYHHGMITNIHSSLSRILKISPHQAIQNHLAELAKSIPYLAWIIRPDGKVPPLGDSEEKLVSTSLGRELSGNELFSSHEGMRVFGEGYAIWKSSSKEYHLTLKSCHHGRFHRHDDDCSITLWVRGQNLIMDSGLLYYQEKDPDRIHVRSAKGHSGFEIPGKKPNRNLFHKTAHCSKVFKIDDSTSKAVLGMYGNLNASRTVNVSEQIVSINDQFSKDCLLSGIILNFIVDEIWDVDISDETIQFSSLKNTSWSMMLKGFSKEINIESTFTSPLRNTKRDAKRISLSPICQDTEIIVDFGGVSRNSEKPNSSHDLPNIGILGSCVTRDMFNFLKIEHLLRDYRARMSITGYGFPSLDANFDFLETLSGFRKSTVLKDLSKEPLPLKKMDVLVIDLIDERFQIYTKNDILFTGSTYLAEASGVSHLNATLAFKRGTKEHFTAFELGMSKLLDDCKLHGVEPILHCARWADLKRISGENIAISEDSAYLERIQRENMILSQLEDIIKKLNPNMKVLSSPDLCVSDPDHKWGMQPFHYINSYYSDIFEQLKRYLTLSGFKI